MRKPALLLSSVLASHLLLTGALANEPGAGTPVPAPYVKVTPQAKAEGKAARKEAGRAAAKDGEVRGETEPAPAPKAKVAKADRQQARAERKQETARAARAGEIKATGEVGPVK